MKLAAVEGFHNIPPCCLEREERIKDLAADNARLRADLESMVRVQSIPAMTVGPWYGTEKC